MPSAKPINIYTFAPTNGYLHRQQRSPIAAGSVKNFTYIDKRDYIYAYIHQQ